MRRILYIIFPIFILLLLPKIAAAGIILRPVINTGLIGYWSFNEGSGNYVGDMSGNGNHGTWSGSGVHWTDGKIGKAGSFDGSSDYIDSSNFADYLPNFTVSAWFKSPGAGTGSYPPIITKITAGNVSTGEGWGIYFRRYGGTVGQVFAIIQSGDGANWRSKYTNLRYDDNNWHHAVMVVTGGNTVTLYIDGAIPSVTNYEGGDISLDPYSNNSNVRIGKDYDSEYFNGQIDEVRIYNRDLDASEIKKLYKSGLSKIGVNNLGLVDPQLPSNATISYVREDCTGYSPCYNSLYDWEADFGGIDFANHGCSNGDLTCLGMTAVARIDGAWSSPDPRKDTIVINGWTTNANNYIYIYTTESARHPGKWDETKYRIERMPGDADDGILISQGTNHVRIDGIQMSIIATGDTYPVGISVASNDENSDIQISNNLIKADITGATTTGSAITVSYSASKRLKIWNNIIYGWKNSYTSMAVTFGTTAGYSGILYAYNNTIYNNDYGIYSYAYSITVAKNNLVYNNADNYVGTFDDYSTNNLSGPTQTDAPGSNPRNGVQVSFVDPNNGDFHLSPADTGARNYGADLSNDTSISFAFDIDRQPRTGAWDIGADEARGTIANAPQTNQLTDGLVGYWSFDGNAIDGNEAKDMSGTGNHGTIYGATKTIGKVGQALDFKGNSSNGDSVKVNHSASLNITGPITISAWIKPRSITGSWMRIVEKGSYATSYYFGTKDLSQDGLEFWYGGTQIAVTASGILKLNQWQHVAVSYSSAGTDIYLNGANVKHSTTTATPSGNNSQLYIGWGESNPCFDGAIDEVRIYNRALEPEEIKRLYNLGR